MSRPWTQPPNRRIRFTCSHGQAGPHQGVRRSKKPRQAFRCAGVSAELRTRLTALAARLDREADQVVTARRRVVEVDRAKLGRGRGFRVVQCRADRNLVAPVAR
jgi:hypothetical protein